jgi:hypothetical protein
MQHLLHLDGILFPHINDDARSKSLQICLCTFSVCPSKGVNLIFARAMNYPQHLITQEVSLLKMKSKRFILS